MISMPSRSFCRHSIARASELSGIIAIELDRAGALDRLW